MRFFCQSIISLCIIFSCTLIASAQTPMLSLQESNSLSSAFSVDLKGSFDLNVILDAGDHHVNGVSVYLTFDSSYLEVVDKDPNRPGIQPFESSSFIDEFILENDTHGDPENDIAGFQLDYTPVSLTRWSTGRGILATITFKAIAPIDSTNIVLDFDYPNARETAISLTRGCILTPFAEDAHITISDPANPAPIRTSTLSGSIYDAAKNTVVIERSYRGYSTRLGDVYPNPANPELWIPFELAEEDQVIIRIYDTVGRTIKTIDLGVMFPGRYISKDMAAHWNGTSENGETVTSGVYFCVLQTKHFVGTKKIVLAK